MKRRWVSSSTSSPHDGQGPYTLRYFPLSLDTKAFSARATIAPRFTHRRPIGPARFFATILGQVQLEARLPVKLMPAMETVDVSRPRRNRHTRLVSTRAVNAFACDETRDGQRI